MFTFAVILAQIGIAWLFIRYLITRDRGPKEPATGLFAVSALAVAGVILAVVLEAKFLPDLNPLGYQDYSKPYLLLYAFGVGLIEEACKVLPVATFLYRKRYFNELTDGLIYFGISGMVFGLLENIAYTTSYGGATGISRIITIPFLHAAFCIAFGLVLAYVKVLRKPKVLIIGGLLAGITLHGLYDFGLFTQTWWGGLLAIAITVSINVSIPFMYKWATKRDATLGLATTGENLYCRHCGVPNPDRFLYCTSCGHKT